MSASTISSPADLASVSQPPLHESARESVRDPAHERGRASLRKPVPPRPLQHPAQRPAQRLPDRHATDDEILGIGTPASEASRGLTDELGDELANASAATSDAPHSADDAAEIPEALRAALNANPELRRVWDDAQAYREAFATPEAARAATAQLADLGRLDALFFSRRPEDHAELARAVAGLDPVAFASLAQAMAALAGDPRSVSARARPLSNGATAPVNGTRADSSAARDTATSPTPAQTEFFHSTNDAAVRGVLDAIESQVERLLPEGVSKSARNRVVGEIYRELDTTLRSNRQLGEQMRQAFGSGALDAAHQRAIVSLVTGRARQALPAVARRVLSEWTSTMVAASHDRRSRQRAAERRVDIAGASGGNDGRRSMTPRDVDYARLSDSDILNL